MFHAEPGACTSTSERCKAEAHGPSLRAGRRYDGWMRDDDEHRLLDSRGGQSALSGQAIAHGRLHVVLPPLLCLLLPVTALAQAGSGEHGQDVSPSPAPKAESRLDLEQRFLRVESSTWAPFGFRLSKNGQAVGPGFFSVVPDDAVTGSKEAMVHARHARVYQGFTLGSGLAGVGLIVGGFAVAGHHERWTQTARLLTAGGILAIFSEFFCALGRERETIKTINAYNYDLVRGLLAN